MTAKAQSNDPDHKKSFRRSWRSSGPVAKLTLICTGIVAIATVTYAVFAGWQLYEIRQGGKDTRRLAEAAQRQADATSQQANAIQAQLDAMRDQANSLRAQTNTLKSSLDETRKAANAAVTQAGASISQAKTSEIFARASQESAKVARQVFEESEQPQIYFLSSRVQGDLVPRQKPEIRIILGNNGKKAYDLRTEMALSLRPKGFSGILPPIYLKPDTIPAELERGESSMHSMQFSVSLTDEQIKGINEGEILLIFYGRTYYRDGLKRVYSFPVCRLYVKGIAPDLGLCPSTIKAPEAKPQNDGERNPN